MIKEYSVYKDTAIDWIGDVPENWKIFRAKYIYDEIKDLSEDGSELLLSVSEYTGVTPRQDVIEEGDHITRADSLIGYKKCRKNDLVMNIMLAWKRGLGVSNHEGIISPAYAVFRNSLHKSDSRYLHYLMRTDLYISEFRRNSTGVIDSRLRLYPDEFMRIFIIQPFLSEQQAIANFLDRKTQQLDTLIEKKQKMIELLKEERTAVINHAVTKGLNPDVKMKDSGIEWLGEIPEHWEVKPLKFLGDIVLGKMLTNNDKGGYHKKLYLRAKNILWKKVHVDDVKEMWFSETELIQYRVKKNDLLVSEGGEVGRTALWNEELDECYIQNSVHKITMYEGNDPFYYLFLSYAYGKQGFYDAIVNRVSIAHLTRDKLKDVRFLNPLADEQAKISNFLMEKTSEIDNLIEKEENSIELLQEYRTALISEAVTGKIDVRDEASGALKND